MTRRRLLLLLPLGALAATVALQALRLDRTRVQLAAARTQNASLQRELSLARRNQHTAERDLGAAETQLAQLAPAAPSPGAPSGLSADPLVASWLGRTRQLRALLERNPSHAIPELQHLTAEDWLRVAREAAFDTDEQRRQALAGLRHAAKLRLVPLLSPAAQQFTLAHLAGVPSTPADLAPYFTTPVASEILARYEIQTETSASSRSRWSLREKVPVDEDYDQRLRIESSGSHGTRSGPLAWHDDYAARLQNAYRTFTAAQPDTRRPPTLAQVVPYIQPPLPPATLEKLLQAERARQP